MATFQYLDEGNSEAQDRLATSFLLAQSSAGLARTGVLSGLVVTQTTTASGAVLIAAGAAPVQASVGTGVALLVNDTLATLDVFTANPMGGLPRNDIVAFDSVTKTVAVIVGTPNATPDDPTVPATACALARLRHAAGATTIPTAKIDSLRVMTVLAAAATAVLTSRSATMQTSTGNATYDQTSFTLPPGRWLVTAGLSLQSMDAADAVAVGVYNATASSVVAFSTGVTAWLGATGTGPVVVRSSEVEIVATADMIVKPIVYPNAGAATTWRVGNPYMSNGVAGEISAKRIG